MLNNLWTRRNVAERPTAEEATDAHDTTTSYLSTYRNIYCNTNARGL